MLWGRHVPLLPMHSHLAPGLLPGLGALVHGAADTGIERLLQSFGAAVALVAERLHLGNEVQAHGRPVLVLGIGLGEETKLFEVRVCQQETLLCAALGDELLLTPARVAEGHAKCVVPLCIECGGGAVAAAAAVSVVEFHGDDVQFPCSVDA